MKYEISITEVNPDGIPRLRAHVICKDKNEHCAVESEPLDIVDGSLKSERLRATHRNFFSAIGEMLLKGYSPDSALKFKGTTAEVDQS